ncbi:hypothetical protein FH972_023372 [Carpinus fangiana]|uniref:Uncharacterized protein n=1 Tax=Carpinus fangiana TaxID=176857 RepID=A0A5N6KVM2_9ROSI|nr:hypothetical protein FH972_023372 [Carpinus fangiana]
MASYHQGDPSSPHSIRGSPSLFSLPERRSLASGIPRYEDVTVGWICALSHELAASRAMLDTVYGPAGQIVSGDDNMYTFGEIAGHNIVMTCMSSYGTHTAATVATDMRRTFPSIKLGFMVGIGAGIPSPEHDICLGDVVVSKPTSNSGGVIQYDLGKISADGSFERRGYLNKPPPLLLKAVQNLQSRHEHEESRMQYHLQQMLERFPILRDEYSMPATERGRTTSDGQPDLKPRIHYGLIASGNKVIANTEERDRLRINDDVLCLEMEAAGLMDTFACLVVRGISDFADAEKNDKWQRYAAASAAAYTKELLESVSSMTGTTSIPRSISTLHLPRDENFVGREAAIEDIKEAFEISKSCPRAALVGLGGVGKTQIAIEYAHRIRNEFPDVSIFWVNGSSPVRFLESYTTIALKLKLPGINDPKSDYLQIVFQWLLEESSGKWLIILDNADNIDFVRPSHSTKKETFDFTMSRYLPQTQNGQILVTSRFREAAGHVASSDCIINLQAMSEYEARTLLDKKLHTEHGNDQDRITLLDELERIPLAITQAASYIDVRPEMTISKYLELLNSNEKTRSKLLKINGADLRRDPDFPNSVLATWQISFEQIKAQNPVAGCLLSRMSIIDRQGIPEFLFKEDDGDLAFEEAKQTLLSYSLIAQETRNYGRCFQMHRLIQIATRDWLDVNGELNQERCKVLTILQDKYPSFDRSFDERVICRALEPHAEAILSQVISHDMKLVEADLLEKMARYHRLTGGYKAAEKIAKQCLNIRKTNLGDTHEDTLYSMYLLGLVHYSSYYLKEAEEIFNLLLSRGGHLNQSKETFTHKVMLKLALVYRRQNQLTKAEQLQDHVLKFRRRTLGDDNKSTIEAMSALASTYYRQRKLVESETLYDTAIECTRKLYGGDSSLEQNLQSHLASVYFDQGKLSEAERIAANGVAIRTAKHGSEDLKTVMRMENLATTYGRQGRIEDQERLEIEVLAIRKKVLGDEHPRTLSSMAKLAVTYGKQKKFAEAEELLLEALSGQKKLLGNHKYTRRSIRHLMQLYKDQGRVGEARVLAKEELKLLNEAKRMELGRLKLQTRLGMRWSMIRTVFQRKKVGRTHHSDSE